MVRDVDVDSCERNTKNTDRVKFSIVIPALHEACTINSLVCNLLCQKTEETFEIIVVDGDPKRETVNAIHHKEVITTACERGRGRQMNVGAALSQGEIIIFLHADTQLPENALRAISSVMDQTHYVGGAFDLGINSHRPLFKLIACLASFRSRFTRIPYGDQALFIRRDYFHTIGRYKEIPIMEDVELMQRIKKRGDDIFILKGKVSTSPRRWEKEGVIYGTVRNWILVSLYYLGVSPDKLMKFYRMGYD